MNPRLNPFDLLRRTLTVLAALFLLAVPLAQAAPSTPTTDFTDNGDGSVTHKTTGLTWKRCAEGMTWTGSTCTGTGSTYDWFEANSWAEVRGHFGLFTDYRLPTIRELTTITEVEADNPAINSTIFPNTPASNFWSKSRVVGSYEGFDGANAWSVDFLEGYSYPRDFDESDYVRLVRGGQSQSLSSPATDYVDNGDGTATHTPTALTWKRCAEGQSWSGSTCSGMAKIYTWDQANALNAGGWRLPTQAELRSLVDYTINSFPLATINSTIFPNAPRSYFWSASAYADHSDRAWDVDFGNGHGGTYSKTDSFQVRLVRGGQSLGPSSTPTPADCLFNWAEKNYSQYFSPAGGAAKTSGEYYYRSYAGNIYLATSSKDNHLYYLIGGKLGDAGAVAQLYAQAGCQ